MLHVVVLRHGPETCPASHPEMQDRCGTNLMRFKEGSSAGGVVVRGLWADPAGHLFFAVVEAPHAHAVTQLAGELELSHWNTVKVHPVTEM